MVVIIVYLVGGWATPLKNMEVNWDDEIPFLCGKIKHGNQTTKQLFNEAAKPSVIIYSRNLPDAQCCAPSDITSFEPPLNILEL